ncbi:MAG: tetratricopeptide repeat protein [Zavarzinella sp.]
MKHKGRPDPYSDCICGSGKQFKWCCNAYYNDFKEGLDLSDAKQTAAAVAAFEKVVKKYPRLPQAWLLLASLASADQQTERAKAALQKAIELEPGTPRALALQIQILTADADGKEEFQSEMVGMCWQMLDQHYTSGDPYVADTIYSLFLAQFIANEQFSQNYLVPLILDEKIRNHIKGEGLKRLRMLLEHWQSKMYLSIGQRFLLPDPAIPAKQLEEWNQLLSIGGILKVKQGCEEFVKNNPTNVVGKFNLALVHTLLGNRTEAKPILEQLLADPSAGEHHEEVAYMLEVYEFSVPADELPEEYSGYVKDLKMRNPQGLQPMLEYFTSQKRALFGESSQNRLLVHLFGKSSTLEIPGVHKFVPQLAQFDAQALENQETQFNLLSDTEADMQQIVAEIQENIIGVFEIPAENEKYFNPSKFFVQVLHPALEGKEEIPPEVGLQLEHILNELWLKMPRKSLQGKTPLEAAQDPTLQPRLKGVVRMLYRVLASSYAAATPWHESG